jgi:ParB-like chromosome segregation protein Spo0J
MFRTINCSQIDFDDTTFLMSYPVESAKILQSVGTIGVLQPIIVSGCACEKYQIIAGFRRVYACRQIGIELVNAYLYPIDPANALSAFLLALHENASHRIFNAVEKSLILTKFVNHFQCDRDEVIRYYLPLLELAPHSKVLDIYLRIAEFEEEIKQYLAAHDLPMAVFEMLANLAAADRMAVFTLISTLKFGVNKLKELLIELDEIALRDSCPIHQILADQSIQDMFQHPDYPVPQKAEQIRQLIRAKRYPHLTTLEKTYRARLKRLHVPPGIRLQTDPTFEDDELAVSFRVQTPEHLQAFAAELLQLAQKPELQELLAVLSGKDLLH